MTNANLKALSDAGVSIWLDDLSRQRITSGNLAQLISEKEVVGVTSNPTIFANALSNAADYNEKVRELAARGAGVDDTVRELTTADVRDAADVFRDVYDRTGGVDGRVSLEVDPRLAHETDKTVAEA
ncbi:transaldolase family protein, partial [Saccharopolyspora griseoalba]